MAREGDMEAEGRLLWGWPIGVEVIWEIDDRRQEVKRIYDRDCEGKTHGRR
jgi:hypothetical protein